MKHYSLTGDRVSQTGAKVTTLENGLRVVSVNRAAHTAVVSVFANVGSRNETAEENGISHFLEHMAFKGTTTRDQHDILIQIESLGADINAFTSRFMTGYYVVGLAEHVTPALDILSDVLLNSTFNEDEIEREKGVVIEEIREGNDDIGNIAQNAFLGQVFDGQPVGRPIAGPEENVAAFTRDMLLSYIDRHYGPSNLIVSVVGPVDHDAFVEQVRERFGHVQPRDQDTPDVPTYAGGVVDTVDERFKQSHVFVGYAAPGAGDPKLAVYSVLGDILGGGMSAPLFQEVREKRSLVYSVFSFARPQPDVSLFAIGGQMTTTNTEEFLRVCAAELAKVAAGQIAEHDWNRARNGTIRSLVSMEEKPHHLARYAASSLFTNGRILELDEAVNEYLSVTREDVIAAATALLSAKPTISVTGAQQELDYAAVWAEGLVA